MKKLTENEFNNIKTELVKNKDFNTHVYIFNDGTYKTLNMYESGHDLKHVHKFYNFYDVEGYFDYEDDENSAEKYDNDENYRLHVNTELQNIAHDTAEYDEYTKDFVNALPQYYKDVRDKLITIDIYHIAKNDDEGDLTSEIECRFGEELYNIKTLNKYNIIKSFVKSCRRSFKYYKTVDHDNFKRRAFNSYVNNCNI